MLLCKESLDADFFVKDSRAAQDKPKCLAR